MGSAYDETSAPDVWALSGYVAVVVGVRELEEELEDLAPQLLVWLTYMKASSKVPFQ